MPSRNNRKKSSNRSRQRKSHKKTYRKTQNKKHKSHTRKQSLKSQRGGSNSCSMATVQEPGFSIPAIGDVPGFSLSDSKGAIHRPNCKTDSYQAMTP
jgi:hypothetical protein